MRGRGPRWLQRRDKEAPSPLDSPRLRPGRAFDDGSRTPSHPRSGGNSPQKGHAMIGTLARKRTNLVGLATLLALVAAMFVALAPAAAATYTCKVNAANSDTLEVHDGTAFVALTASTGVAAPNDADGNDCPVDSSNPGDDFEPWNTSQTAGAAGDVVNKVQYDSNNDNVINDTDNYRWELDYQQHTAEAVAGKTAVLLLDNPDNPTSGTSTGVTRPQMTTIPGLDASFTATDGDKIETSDETGTIIVLGGGGGTSDWTVKAGKAGTVTVTVTDGSANLPDVVSTYTFEVKSEDPADMPPAALKPSLSIKFVADADSAYAYGPSGAVRVLVTATDNDLVRLDVNGGLSFYDVTTEQTWEPDADDATKRVKKGRASVSRAVIGGSVLNTDDLLVATNGAYMGRDDDNSATALNSDNPNGPIGANKADKTLTRELIIPLPALTAAGEYTVTAVGSYTRSGSTTKQYISKSKALTVGDVGEVDSVELMLSSPRRAVGDDVDKVGGGATKKLADGYADDASTSEPDVITVGAGNNTELSLQIRNTNGKASEAGAISSIVLSTTNGTLNAQVTNSAAGAEEITYLCDQVAQQRTCELKFDEYRAAGEPVPDNIRVLLSAAERPGKATVSAYVIDRGGKLTPSNEVEVVFAGEPDELKIVAVVSTVLGFDASDGAPSGVASTDNDSGMVKRDRAILLVHAVDSTGQQVKTPDVSVKVTNPDGSTLSSAHYGFGGVAGADYQTQLNDADDFDTLLLFEITKARRTKLPAGEYGVTLTSKDDSTLKVSGNFTIAHPADSVELALTGDDGEALESLTDRGQEMVATVTVTDADGNNVADGTRVVFRASDVEGDADTVVVAISDDTPKTKAGMASVTYVAVGPGAVVVTATVEDDNDAATAPKKAVTVIDSSAGAPAVVEPDPAARAAAVELSVVGEDFAAGDTVTVTATVTDAEGNAMPDGTKVSFYHSGGASLFGPASTETNGGTASAQFMVSDDLTVGASSDGIMAASLAIEVTSDAEQQAIDDAAAEEQRKADEAEAEEQRLADEAEAKRIADEAEAARADAVDAETERLTGTSGFGAWLSEHGTTASDLFAATGASAIHLWNGSDWVRYSVVSGSMVPGSVDFDVNQGDVLYFSN